MARGSLGGVALCPRDGHIATAKVRVTQRNRGKTLKKIPTLAWVIIDRPSRLTHVCCGNRPASPDHANKVKIVADNYAAQFYASIKFADFRERSAPKTPVTKKFRPRVTQEVFVVKTFCARS